MKSEELARRLNELNVRLETAEGRVVRLYSGDEDLTEEQLVELGIDPSLGYLDDHPEGRDRGGYVPYVVSVHKFEVGGNEYNWTVYFYEPDQEWRAG